MEDYLPEISGAIFMGEEYVPKQSGAIFKEEYLPE